VINNDCDISFSFVFLFSTFISVIHFLYIVMNAFCVYSLAYFSDRFYLKKKLEPH